MAEREFIEETHYQRLRSIELTDGLFGFSIVGVLTDETVGTDETGDARARGVGIGYVLRNRVRDEKGQALRDALIELQLHRVVCGVPRAIRTEGIIFLVEVAVLREWPENLVDWSVEWKTGVWQLDPRGDRLWTLVFWLQASPSRR